MGNVLISGNDSDKKQKEHDQNIDVKSGQTRSVKQNWKRLKTKKNKTTKRIKNVTKATIKMNERRHKILNMYLLINCIIFILLYFNFVKFN